MSADLFNADLATVSDLAAARRARTTIADLEAAYRADMVTAYVNARTERARLQLLEQAATYDREHPNEPVRLADEMYGTGLGAAA